MPRHLQSADEGSTPAKNGAFASAFVGLKTSLGWDLFAGQAELAGLTERPVSSTISMLVVLQWKGLVYDVSQNA